VDEKGRMEWKRALTLLPIIDIDADFIHSAGLEHTYTQYTSIPHSGHQSPPSLVDSLQSTLLGHPQQAYQQQGKDTA